MLILGQAAEVHANVQVGTLIIRGGTLWGDVRASQLVEIYAPAKVYGNIHAPQLYIDKGVVFEGSCKMLEEPSDAASKPDTPER